MKTEMKAQYTQGPWRVAPASEYAGSDLNVDANQKGYICKAGVRGDAEAEANARLISSAPELLEAAKQLLKVQEFDDTEMSPEEFALARAIAKAEGR